MNGEMYGADEWGDEWVDECPFGLGYDVKLHPAVLHLLLLLCRSLRRSLAPLRYW